MATWLAPIEAAQESQTRLTLSVPNPFSLTWVKDNYLPIILDCVREVAGNTLSVEFVVRKESPEEASTSSVQEAPPPEEDVTVTDEWALSHNLNPRYTFESFVVGSCNQFAHAAASSVADRLGATFNPLFLYGGVGLGKTHLMSAIGYRALKADKKTRLCFITSEEFTNEMINAIRFDKMTDFREKYRKLDLLMIDDIQFLAGKERTQEEFFHTFNRIYETRKQIVITSDRLPGELTDIEHRLRSRFSWGLVADLGVPDLETRVAILRRKAYEDAIELPDNVAYFLAKQAHSNVRDLVGYLIRVAAVSSLQAKPLDIDLAQAALKDVVRMQDRPISIDTIITTVSKAFNVKPSDIKSKKKHKLYSFPRQVGMYLSRELTDHSYPEIGAAFGGKDHSTVIYAAKKIESIIEKDNSLRTMIEGIKREMKR
jgi:chromosomal replication initiator protein